MMTWTVGIVAVALAALAVTAIVRPRERSLTLAIEFDATPREVFAVYSDPASQPAWRDAVASVEMKKDSFPRAWVERPRRGPAIRFEEVEVTAPALYVLDLAAQGAFAGRYAARFEELADGRTRGTFTESVTLLNPVAALISHAFVDLEREITTYAREAQAEIVSRRR